MIIIATVGRSGSSFLTKWLSECGVDVGSELWFDKFKAGLENAETCTINRKLLDHLVKGTKVNLYHAYGDIHELSYKVVKDPQFASHPMIIKYWWEVRKDIKIIFLHRNPESVVESVKKIPEWTGPTYRCFPEMINEKNDDFLRQVERLGIPYVKYKFPQFLDQAKEIIEDLKYWIKLPEDAEQIWDNLRDQSKRVR